MKRMLLLTLPLLLSACGTPSEYARECDFEYDKFDDVFACTKVKLGEDPRNVSVVPHTLEKPDQDAMDAIAYGEQLNSKVRQGLLTDDKAIDMFEDKLSQ